MNRALLAGMTTLALLVGLLLNSWSAAVAPAAKTSGRFWVKLTFGLDERVADWDGGVKIRDGEILQIESWGFEKIHKLDTVNRRWTCSTEVNNVRELSTYAEPYRGLLVEVSTKPDSVLLVDTKQGRFEVPVAELQAGRPSYFLKQAASVELLGTARQLFGANGIQSHMPDSSTEDDFPTLAIDAAGHRWAAWIGYDDSDKCDRLYTLDLDRPNALLEPVETDRLQSSPKLLSDANGSLWLFWSAPLEDNWELWAAQRKPNGWSERQRLTRSEGSDMRLVGAGGPNGEMWLAWQSPRNGNSDIFAKRYHNGSWTDDIAVAKTPANEWEPSISVAADGRAWIGYDSYQNGNYDVLLTSVNVDQAGKPQRGPTVPIAATPDFEAHASVEATVGDTVWVAYDAAGPNWGKDVAGPITTRNGKYSDPIHATRRVELRAVADGKVWKPKLPLPQKLDTLRPKTVAHKYMGEVKRFYELPQLTRDEAGRLWLFFRLNRQGFAEDPIAALWEEFATAFVDGQWLEPILLPQSGGRQDQRIAFVLPSKTSATKNANVSKLQIAWSTGHHMTDTRQTVRVGTLPPVSGSVNDPALVPSPVDTPVVQTETPIRSWKMKHGGKSLEVYFGDMHRHTDISWCYPTVDGSLVDAHRYALDAAQLDFLVITDHTRDTDAYPWWRTQKSADRFNIPGEFTTIYGYERSNQTPGGGHRNVFFTKRDWPVYRSDHHYKHIGKPLQGRNDPEAALYPKLRGQDAFTAAHTPAYSPQAMRGTWSYHDPEVEPLVEVFQGFRRDYLRPENRLAEEASIWYALSHGYKLGFIASSDHVSTHMSYACVWSAGPSRQQLFEAMRARRTYAATDKILLEFRVNGAVMGEELELTDADKKASKKPILDIRVRGTAKIKAIQIVRNRQVIRTLNPNRDDYHIAYEDTKYPGGPAWYYVQIEQTDGNRAWGSPVWVR